MSSHPENERLQFSTVTVTLVIKNMFFAKIIIAFLFYYEFLEAYF